MLFGFIIYPASTKPYQIFYDQKLELDIKLRFDMFLHLPIWNSIRIYIYLNHLYV